MDALFASNLPEGWQQFLSQSLRHARAIARIDAKQFTVLFPPKMLMKALEPETATRALILTETTGLKHKIALTRSVDAGAEDLASALELGETTSAIVDTLVEADLCVRHLDKQLIWAYLTALPFWTAPPDAPLYDGSKRHLLFMLEQAVEHKLLDAKTVVHGLGVKNIVKLIAIDDVAAIIERALANTDQGKPFSADDLLAAAPLKALVEHIPLPEIWNKIMIQKIAEPNGFVRQPSGSEIPASVSTGSDEEDEWQVIPAQAVVNATPPTSTSGADKPAEHPAEPPKADAAPSAPTPDADKPAEARLPAPPRSPHIEVIADDDVQFVEVEDPAEVAALVASEAAKAPSNAPTRDADKEVDSEKKGVAPDLGAVPIVPAVLDLTGVSDPPPPPKKDGGSGSNSSLSEIQRKLKIEPKLMNFGIRIKDMDSFPASSLERLYVLLESKDWGSLDDPLLRDCLILYASDAAPGGHSRREHLRNVSMETLQHAFVFALLLQNQGLANHFKTKLSASMPKAPESSPRSPDSNK